MSSGIVHEIKNPISGILMSMNNIISRLDIKHPHNIDAAKDVGIEISDIDAYLTKRKIRKVIQNALDAANRTMTIIETMRNFSRRSGLAISEVNIYDLIEQTLELCAYDSGSVNFSKIDVNQEINVEYPFIKCDPNSLQQVFLNILRNGAQAMFEKKDSLLKSSKSASYAPQFFINLNEDDDYMIVEFQDNGPGMDEHVKAHLFDPFFTTKESEHGTGLGLSVSQYIVSEVHKGILQVESVKGQGTNFIIKLKKDLEDG